MRQATKIAMVRGAGLAFPIAALLFVFTWQIHFFALLPLGALAGFGLEAFLHRRPSASAGIRATWTRLASASGARQIGKFLFHHNLWVRFAGLTLLSAALLLLAWCAGYYLLPEGFLRGGAQAHMERAALSGSSPTVLAEWLKIFRANLLPVVIILAGSALIRVNSVSMGYLVVFVNVIGYGLFLGSNSFAIAMPERMAPSLAVFARSGPYEMLALILLAAAAYRWARFEIRRIFQTIPEAVAPRPAVTAVEVLAVALGLFVLGAANLREAVMVAAAAL